MPDEFWIDNLEPVLDEALANFIKYSDQLDKITYLGDFIKCLVSFGIREISSPLFLAKVEKVIAPLVAQLDSKSIENLLFFVMRAGTGPLPSGLASRNISIITSICKTIADKEWLLKGEVNDHFAILQLLNQNKNQFPKLIADQLFS